MHCYIMISVINRIDHPEAKIAQVQLQRKLRHNIFTQSSNAITWIWWLFAGFWVLFWQRVEYTFKVKWFVFHFMDKLRRRQGNGSSNSNNRVPASHSLDRWLCMSCYDGIYARHVCLPEWCSIFTRCVCLMNGIIKTTWCSFVSLDLKKGIVFVACNLCVYSPKNGLMVGCDGFFQSCQLTILILLYTSLPQPGVESFVLPSWKCPLKCLLI